MKTIELKKLKKEKSPKQIIYLHCHNEIYLTEKQIDNLIKERDKKAKSL